MAGLELQFPSAHSAARLYARLLSVAEERTSDPPSTAFRRSEGGFQYRAAHKT
jgi:hypothetical protein